MTWKDIWREIGWVCDDIIDVGNGEKERKKENDREMSTNLWATDSCTLRSEEDTNALQNSVVCLNSITITDDMQNELWSLDWYHPFR